MQEKLSWGLIVCTLNREQFLMECLKHILNQTRKPAEIVVVDASDYWKDNHQLVTSTYADQLKDVRLVYDHAEIRSIPHQRNQALLLSQSDIIFSLDDDIYLFPDAAEIIMSAYEKDEKEEIAMIGGLFSHGPPGEETTADHDEEYHAEQSGLLGKIKNTLEQQLTLTSHFVPYGDPVDMNPIPSSVQGMDLVADGLINGGRTTFRRRFGIQSQWTPLLRYYATHEDSDFSYRTSQFGRLVTASKALFFHADGNDSQAKRFKINTIRVRNLMALHRFYSDNKLRSAWRLFSSFAFFIGLYLLIDPVQKRFSCPTVRAYALGAAMIPYFMFKPSADFKDWYIQHQEKMYQRK